MEGFAIVTGTSKGIGKAIAAQLVRSGLRVLATSRDATLGEKTAKELGVPFHQLDVSSAESVDALARFVEKTERGVDVVVNNAGISMKGFDENVARGTLDVNFHGAVRVTDRLLPLVRKNGRIVMVSSGMGELSHLRAPVRERVAAESLTRAELMAVADQFVREVAAGTHEKSGFPSSAYSVSKVLLNAYVRVLARELAGDPRGIMVNAACPGWVRTDMGGASAPRSPAAGAKTPVYLATLPPGGPTGGFFRDERSIPF